MTAAPAASIDTYQSDRRFQMWRYDVGHSQLLLRSVRGGGHKTRIDILFKGVSALDLRTSFDTLTIDRDGHRFTLKDRAWSGSVSASACFLAEDDGDYFDPSPFDESFG